MLIYSNGFHVSAKTDLSEVLIRFLQTTPQFDSGKDGETKPIAMKEEEVASLIISGKVARALVEKISSIMDEQ